FWDYGPLGVELKNNIKKEWWKYMVLAREDVVGIDAAIIMNPTVWVKSGHVAAFTDPLIECEVCHKRFRPDKIGLKPKIQNNKIIAYFYPSEMDCPSGGHKLQVVIKQVKEIDSEKLVEPSNFNLLVTAQLGVVEKQDVYLRGEITQGVFVNFRNVVDTTRIKIPFGIAQIGKAFRNEITPGNFSFRSREFEQMELEYFIEPDDKTGEDVFSYWKEQRLKWYLTLGLKRENLRYRDHEPEERAHYARFATDIEYRAPFGWSEFEGIHHRGDWDLSRHNLKYRDEISAREFTPWVIETSGGVDRSFLFFLVDAYHEENKRIVLRLNPKLAPFKIAVFPLLANKEQLVKKAREIYLKLKKKFYCVWDDRGNIGKRYLSQDEIGTPWCITVDFTSLDDETVTVRDRDTTKQERIKIAKLDEYFENKLLALS
ncbi:glycine--tRNA ligase, partial [Candidatus Microgenomates bacterium]|nr:glycine--tRNA ligase [Candidatus Microgenomates bacterium]